MNIGRKHKEIPNWIINAVEEKIMTPTKGAKLALEENNLSEHNKKYKKYLLIMFTLFLSFSIGFYSIGFSIDFEFDLFISQYFTVAFIELGSEFILVQVNLTQITCSDSG